MWNQNKIIVYIDHHTKYFALLSMYFQSYIVPQPQNCFRLSLWLIHRAGLVRGERSMGSQNTGIITECVVGGWDDRPCSMARRREDDGRKQQMKRYKSIVDFIPRQSHRKEKTEREENARNEVNQSKVTSLKIGEDHGKHHEVLKIPIVNT